MTHMGSSQGNPDGPAETLEHDAQKDGNQPTDATNASAAERPPATAPYTASPFPANGPLLASDTHGRVLQPGDLDVHDRLDPELMHGWIDVTARTLTPTICPDTSDDEPDTELLPASVIKSRRQVQYVIPGTTMAGMIRNVMRSICGGRIPEVDDPAIFVRFPFNRTGKEYDDSELKRWMTDTSTDLRKRYVEAGGSSPQEKESAAKAGFLKRSAEGSWQIEPTDGPYKANIEMVLKAMGDDRQVFIPPLPSPTERSHRGYNCMDAAAAMSFRPNQDAGERSFTVRTDKKIVGTGSIQYAKVTFARKSGKVRGIADGQSPNAKKLAIERADATRPNDGEELPFTEEHCGTGVLYFTGIAGEERVNCFVFPDPDVSQEQLSVPDEVIAWVNDPAQLSDYQKENFLLDDLDSAGTLETSLAMAGGSHPIWYRTKGKGEVIALGRAGGYRVPAALNADKSPRSALDGVPTDLLHSSQRSIAHDENWQPDAIQALFGDIDMPGGWGKLTRRVRFSTFTSKPGYHPKDQVHALTLYSPKPSAFLHYLMQPSDDSSVVSWSNNPDDGALKVRGYKQYLHRSELASLTVNPQDDEDIDKNAKRIKVLKAGVEYKGRVTFSNLTSSELGLLLAALELDNGPNGGDVDEKDPVSAHKIGLGKPLGFGSVHLTHQLTLVNPVERWRAATSSPFRGTRHGGRDCVKEAYELLRDRGKSACLRGVLMAYQWQNKLPPSKTLTMKVDGDNDGLNFDRLAPLPSLDELWPKWKPRSVKAEYFDTSE